MSTRASIIIKEGGNNIYLYHHSNGYVSGVGVDLRNFLADYGKKEKKEFAIWDAEDIATKLVHRKMSELDVGYQVAICLHGDIEHAYIIDCDKRTLTAFTRPDGFPDVETFGEWNQTLLLADNKYMLVEGEVIKMHTTSGKISERYVTVTHDTLIVDNHGNLDTCNGIDPETWQPILPTSEYNADVIFQPATPRERDKYQNALRASEK